MRFPRSKRWRDSPHVAKGVDQDTRTVGFGGDNRIAETFRLLRRGDTAARESLCNPLRGSLANDLRGVTVDRDVGVESEVVTALANLERDARPAGLGDSRLLHRGLEASADGGEGRGVESVRGVCCVAHDWIERGVRVILENFLRVYALGVGGDVGSLCSLRDFNELRDAHANFRAESGDIRVSKNNARFSDDIEDAIGANRVVNFGVDGNGGVSCVAHDWIERGVRVILESFLRVYAFFRFGTLRRELRDARGSASREDARSKTNVECSKRDTSLQRESWPIREPSRRDEWCGDFGAFSQLRWT